METLDNAWHTAADTFRNEINAYQSHGKQWMERGEEPLSGVQGKGTATDPYDAGNRQDQPGAPAGQQNTAVVPEALASITPDDRSELKSSSTGNPSVDAVGSGSNPTGKMAGGLQTDSQARVPEQRNQASGLGSGNLNSGTGGSQAAGVSAPLGTDKAAGIQKGNQNTGGVEQGDLKDLKESRSGSQGISKPSVEQGDLKELRSGSTALDESQKSSLNQQSSLKPEESQKPSLAQGSSKPQGNEKSSLDQGSLKPEENQKSSIDQTDSKSLAEQAPQQSGSEQKTENMGDGDTTKKDSKASTGGAAAAEAASGPAEGQEQTGTPSKASPEALKGPQCAPREPYDFEKELDGKSKGSGAHKSKSNENSKPAASGDSDGAQSSSGNNHATDSQKNGSHHNKFAHMKEKIGKAIRGGHHSNKST